MSRPLLDRVCNNRLTWRLARLLPPAYPLHSPLCRSLMRALVMRGLRHPFYREDAPGYWASRTAGERHGPQQYVHEDAVTRLTLDWLLARLPAEASFLEIGCNAGRNLQYLYRSGRRALSGIDINHAAVHEVLPAAFPELARTATLVAGDAAAWLRTQPDRAYDVVFAIGVLIHMPPDRMGLFADMLRTARRYVAVFTTGFGYPYPYDFRRLFAQLGATLVYEEWYADGRAYAAPHGLEQPGELMIFAVPPAQERNHGQSAGA